MADSVSETGPLGQSVMNVHLMVQDESNKWVPLKAAEGGLVTSVANPTPPTAVLAATALTDNAVVRGDGGVRGVQTSGVIIDDSNNVTGMTTLTLPNLGLHLAGALSSPYDLILQPTDGALTADRVLGINTSDGDRVLTLANNLTASGTARSVVGRAGSTNGSMADIVTTAGKFLGDRGSALGAFFPTQILSKSSAYPLVTDDYGATVLVTAAATITLPAPATVGSGWWCCIKKTAAAGSDVTIARNASETIDGRSASDVLKAQYAFATYVTDGTNWHVLEVNDYVETTVTNSPTYAITTSTWGDATSVALPPGEWDITGSFATNNVTTVSAGVIGIGSASGTGTTGLSPGVTQLNILPPTAAAGGGGAVPACRVQGSTTPYYLKVLLVWTVAPTYNCRISARRVG